MLDVGVQGVTIISVNISGELYASSEAPLPSPGDLPAEHFPCTLGLWSLSVSLTGPQEAPSLPQPPAAPLPPGRRASRCS